ncbi:MAG: hypothetical protein M3Y87_17530 [Myxococcota bacterium]|nr:hypothetical protein [Myxococcota bacterium]
MRALLPILVVLAATGCCFGDFARGASAAVSLQTECEAVITTANAATARVESMPDPLAGIDEPTPEQIAGSMEPLAQVYDQAAIDLAAIPVTNPALGAQRDALGALYREGGATLRAQAVVMANGMRSGDLAAIQGAMAAAEALGPREDAIIIELNRVCSRQ